jgi:hypothetical protein
VHVRELQAWSVCERCLPLPGDAVACTIATRRGDGEALGMLHRANCECLDLRREVAAGGRLIRPSPALAQQYSEKMAGLLRSQAPPGVGGVDATRAGVLTTKIIVFTTDRPGLLLAVSAVVTAETLNIIDVVSKTQEVP